MKTSTKETMRPLAERITQGPITRDGAVLLIKHSRTGMLFFKAYVGTPENAELITEAFTVCQETSKTPRQLADEVSDIREQVKEHDACADAWCAKAKALNQERAELIAAVLAWWQEHQFDTTDGGTRNLYDDDPAFVTLAQRLQP